MGIKIRCIYLFLVGGLEGLERVRADQTVEHDQRNQRHVGKNASEELPQETQKPDALGGLLGLDHQLERFRSRTRHRAFRFGARSLPSRAFTAFLHLSSNFSLFSYTSLDIFPLTPSNFHDIQSLYQLPSLHPFFRRKRYFDDPKLDRALKTLFKLNVRVFTDSVLNQTSLFQLNLRQSLQILHSTILDEFYVCFGIILEILDTKINRIDRLRNICQTTNRFHKV